MIRERTCENEFSESDVDDQSGGKIASFDDRIEALPVLM